MSHPQSSVRRSALILLAKIGSTRETAPSVALLSDPDLTVAVAAAKTLAEIGDERTLQAMDIWLNAHRDREGQTMELVRGHVTKHRDTLKQRLDSAKKAPK